MPPRKRKNKQAVESAAEPASPSPDPNPERSPPGSDASPTSPASPSADLSHNDSEPPRFFNTTFTTYRVSPLYVGKQKLTPARLQLLSKRLRDALVGDVVRGVQVGLDSDAELGRTGALYAVEWRWIDTKKILGGSRREGSVELGNDSDETERAQGGKRRVLSIELKYENARFSALLLSDLSGDEAIPGSNYQPSWTWQTNDNSDPRPGEDGRTAFLHLPLLLFRMPAPLKSLLIDFLSNTFDCRVSPLALGTQTLVSSWEAWLSDNHSKRNRHVPSKHILITLGFHIEPRESKGQSSGNELDDTSEQDQGQKRNLPHVGIKTIDITIPASDVYRFLRVGEKLDSKPPAAVITRKRKTDAQTTLSDDQQSRRRRKLAGGKDEEGWAWRRQYHGSIEGEAEDNVIKQPFTDALAAYMWHHLGLDMFHPGVRVQRVACDGFALSEGRLKVFTPVRGHSSDGDGDEQESSAWKLVQGLVRKAKGTSSWASEAAAKIIGQR
ncbi:kinetochore complex Sim4 subunit Fta1-domain-containing protein [Daldinia loculata]|uniref:kinetochore complex Sim4 subunit Fta1-domain-containing protein n=1 Tax=Daldinia loculata TaxID=103429 RepID=UPI0020C1CEF1|nr:kinetochore complex Sim4 subunit Fta1-domain-containing protein [Daldinia loculata]KAI1643105.1 kinetochore complex Sim4 subunit Fta1-domain-containing protein [Daldinia loculata]